MMNLLYKFKYRKEFDLIAKKETEIIGHQVEAFGLMLHLISTTLSADERDRATKEMDFIIANVERLNEEIDSLENFVYKRYER